MSPSEKADHCLHAVVAEAATRFYIVDVSSRVFNHDCLIGRRVFGHIIMR